MMMKLAHLIDRDRVIVIPPAELGRRMLPLLAAWPHNISEQLQLVQLLPRVGVPSHQDYLGDAVDHRKEKIDSAIREAWAWLVGQGLLRLHPVFDDGVYTLSSHAKRLAEFAHINIFISYRSNDDPGNVQALYSQLKEQVFTGDQLFMDVDKIAAGTDFPGILNSKLAECRIVLAVIGEGWLDAKDKFGNRSLDNPRDWVRVEIESGLTQGKPVIPVLLREARMPHANELPEPLRPLATRNAVRLRHERFADDVRHLIESMQEALEQSQRLPVRKSGSS
jgi:hypothetical protein